MLTQIGILILSHLIIPTSFLIWLSRDNDKNKIDWFIKLLLVSSYSIYVFLAGRWDWLSYYLRFILVILFFVAAFKSYAKARNLPFNSTRNFKNWLYDGTNCFALIIFSALNILVLQGYFFSEQSVQLSFPLQNGAYYIAHGGNSSIVNYHNADRAQRYALDIVKLNLFGTRAKGLYPQELTKYAIFGDSLYSPCNGEVKETMDACPDLIPPEMDREHPTGNYVLIECKGVDVLVAHLMRGSVAVEAESSVGKGQLIGKVGNSGNTSEPHLHIHARKTSRDSILGGEGVPMIFDGRFLVRNSLVN